ncbi:TetR/AcrR family transcriptional regulator [Streptomyces sp. NPDC055210]
MSAVAPEEPAWRRRAVERSTRGAGRPTPTARVRAVQRAQRFVDSAHALVDEKKTMEFTVQEVVDRSRQTLRSFYEHFDGKHGLQLAVFEDALSRSAAEIRSAAASVDDPLDALRLAVGTLYEQAHPATGVRRALFSDFGPRLLLTHPAQVATAHVPLLAVFTELVERAARADVVPAGAPGRRAGLVVQTVLSAARAHRVPADDDMATATANAEEVWRFCLGGLGGPYDVRPAP